jgi:hypothetical protein
MDICETNRVLKNLMVKIKIKCLGCKEQFNYDAIDAHELVCFRCGLCNTKFEAGGETVMQHLANSCPDYRITCPFCHIDNKRKKFKGHKCNKIEGT